MKKLFLLLCSFFVCCTHNDDQFTINYQDTYTNSEKYIVVYNANGAQGTPPIDTNVYSCNDAVTVMPNSGLYKDQLYFIGWSVCADCSQGILKPSYTFTITSSTMLYACFTNQHIYTVIYTAPDADGGYPPTDTNYYISGEKAYIKSNTGNLSKAGHHFTGWQCQHSQTIYQPGQFIIVGNDTIALVAHFTPKPFTVTYHPNGANSGNVPHDTLYYDDGDAVTIAHNTGYLAIINNDGVSYCFDHWNDMCDSSGNNYYPGDSYTIHSSLQLYACYRPYTIGDTGPAGGIVFYDKGNYADNWRYLEALPQDISLTGILWEEQLQAGSYRQTNATSTEIGGGLSNTLKISQVLGNGNYAAILCLSLNYGNHNSWYLPSKDELQLLYQNKALIGNFGNNNYWSSSEYSTSKAWYQNFSTGAVNTQYKNNSYRVRAIRQF